MAILYTDGLVIFQCVVDKHLLINKACEAKRLSKRVKRLTRCRSPFNPSANFFSLGRLHHLQNLTARKEASTSFPTLLLSCFSLIVFLPSPTWWCNPHNWWQMCSSEKFKPITKTGLCVKLCGPMVLHCSVGDYVLLLKWQLYLNTNCLSLDFLFQSHLPHMLKQDFFCVFLKCS